MNISDILKVEIKEIRMLSLFRTFLLVTLMVGSFAQSSNSSNAEIILTVSGKGLDAPIYFDSNDIAKMANAEFATTTIWTEGIQEFKGVSLKDLLDELGISDGGLRASAINDYSVYIPVSDAVKGGPIIAYSLNGKAMSIRDKGPLWLVYPYDLKQEYASEVIYSRSIWQLDRIEITE
jgi:hypothetical protein